MGSEPSAPARVKLSLRKFLLGSCGRPVRLRGCLIAHARYRRTVIVSDEPGDKIQAKLFQSSTEPL